LLHYTQVQEIAKALESQCRRQPNGYFVQSDRLKMARSCASYSVAMAADPVQGRTFLGLPNGMSVSTCTVEGAASRATEALYWESVEKVTDLDDSVKSEWPEPQVQIRLLHDIFGNPFRPINLNPTWLTPTVTNLAESIYADRSFEKMPILADALEDASSDNADILSHCRSGQDHVRGCWCLDLVLGKK
jgi:hypothetical protein